MADEKIDYDEIFRIYEEVGQCVERPQLAQVTLGALRGQMPAWDPSDTREDLLTLIADSKDLPDEAIVQITQDHCGILVNDDGHMLEFS
jgi:hypothetical protein